MKCPSCPQHLRAERAGGGEIHLCPGCGGVLLSASELRRWVRDEPNPRAVADSLVSMPFSSEAPEIDCPACSLQMERHHRVSTDMTVDLCPRCEGIWFEPAELGKANRARELTPNAFERVSLRLLHVVDALRNWREFEEGGKRRMRQRLIQAALALERAELLLPMEARELVDQSETPAGGEEAVRRVELEGYLEMLYQARVLSREQYEDKRSALRNRSEL